MERHANLCQESLEIFPADRSPRSISHSLQILACTNARLGIHPRERFVVIPRLEIITLLLGELNTERAYDSCTRTKIRQYIRHT